MSAAAATRLCALAVDDNPDVLDEVRDRLEAMGHACQGVDSVETARQALGERRFDYVLLDLEVPSAFGRPTRLENGMALLGEINRALPGAPVIVITAHGHDTCKLAAAVMRSGESHDYLCKPLARPGTGGRTLEEAITQALSRQAQAGKGPRPAATAFTTGIMRFAPDRVELCGVAICGAAGSSRARMILDALRATNDQGRGVAYAGEELAEKVQCFDAGQNAICAAIRDLRGTIRRRLLEGANLACDPQEIIQSGGPGYRLNRRLVRVEDGTGGSGTAVPQGEPASAPAPGPDADIVSPRQVWILAELRTGRQLRSRDVQAHWKCSEKTASREFGDLRDLGRIVFEGPAKTGYWVLRAEASAPAARP